MNILNSRLDRSEYIENNELWLRMLSDDKLATEGYHELMENFNIEYIKKSVGLPTEASPDYVNASINAVGGHENLNFDEANKKLKYSRKKLSLSGYAARLMRVYQFLDLLENTQAQQKFFRHLDIGCGFGIQSPAPRGMWLFVVDRSLCTVGDVVVVMFGRNGRPVGSW